MTLKNTFPTLLQRFFTDRLISQRRVSPHTIAGYRDAFRLLLRFAQEQLKKEPSQIQLADLDASFIVDSLSTTLRRSDATAREVETLDSRPFTRSFVTSPWRNRSMRLKRSASWRSPANATRADRLTF